MSGLPLDTDKLQEIERITEKATPGPWFFESGNDPQVEILVSGAIDDEGLHAPVLMHGYELGSDEIEANWEFVQRAREYVPALLAEVHRLKEDGRCTEKAATCQHIAEVCSTAEKNYATETALRLDWQARAETAESTLSRLTEERDELAQWKREAQGRSVCSYCGEISNFEPENETAMLDAILAHIEVCEKSPVKQLLAATAELEEYRKEERTEGLLKLKLTAAEQKVFHVGKYIKDELHTRGWTQLDLAYIMGRKIAEINNLVGGRLRQLSPELAQELAVVFGRTAEYWLGIDTAYRLSQTDYVNQAVVLRSELFSYPIKEMQKRGWIAETLNATELQQEVDRLLSGDLGKPMSDSYELPFAASFKRTIKESSLNNAEKAWLARARQLARAWCRFPQGGWVA